jgi:hypothetical protein
LNELARRKGFYFIGWNTAGNNAYFLSNLHRSVIPEIDISLGFQESGFRESRNETGVLTFAETSAELELARGLPVINIVTGAEEAVY